jgi:nitrogen fixation protein FixH
MKPGAGWPIAIVALLGLNMGIVGVTIYFAASGRTSEVVPDYDTKALHWDDSVRRQAANRALGWTATPTLTVAGSGTSRLEVTLTDGAGAPIRNATVRVVAFHEADPGAKFELDMTALKDGRYEAALTTDRSGRWRVQIAVDAVGTRFTSESSIDMRTGGEAQP